MGCCRNILAGFGKREKKLYDNCVVVGEFFLTGFVVYAPFGSACAKDGWLAVVKVFSAQSMSILATEFFFISASNFFVSVLLLVVSVLTTDCGGMGLIAGEGAGKGIIDVNFAGFVNCCLLC